MEFEIKVRTLRTYANMLHGDSLSKMIEFNCPRCSRLITFFLYEEAPTACRCGRDFPDIVELYTSLPERVKHHFNRSAN